ncbi:MAG: tetratricopeptide repeat protein [Proteobacteria bacterium]|nr:MAG: tetratricopeptide repeat protein [Pseudomonadota bacterium]
MEKEFLNQVAVTIIDGIEPAPADFVISTFSLKRALEFVSEGLGYQRAGNTAKAAEAYQRSIAILPTAEAYCFLGWAESARGKLDLAIRYCRKAIEIDPEFGNAYNDIGSYHVRKGKWNEAVEWFEKAKLATRYDSPQYPYLNLGRLYSAQGSLFLALKEFKEARRLAPEDQSIPESIEKLQAELSC